MAQQVRLALGARAEFGESRSACRAGPRGRNCAPTKIATWPARRSSFGDVDRLDTTNSVAPYSSSFGR